MQQQPKLDAEAHQRLLKYAKALGINVYHSEADLDPNDRLLTSMAPWCQRHGDIAVLLSGTILTANPDARHVQSCKTQLRNMGYPVGDVIPATQALITLLLANAESVVEDTDKLDSPISIQQQRLRMLVKDAVKQGVTDIHLEVRQHACVVRFRQHGQLYLHAQWLARIGREIASVAFNKETDHANSYFNPLIPQDAAMPLQLEHQAVRLRLASIPAHGGFDVVMRILSDADEQQSDLNTLGYTAAQQQLIQQAINMPHGAVFIAGPTGCGKTTTLAACMRLVSDERKVYTIEDPVEKLITNVTQVPVNTDKADRDFAGMGRASLRMDPDVLVLGETRDQATAQVVMRAAITGHLVFSTIHTNSAVNIITRLVDFGISPNLLADTDILLCLISQRLVSVLCEVCRVPFVWSQLNPKKQEVWQAWFTRAQSIKQRGPGCAACQHQGISGRTVIAEIIWLDDICRDYIKQTDTHGLRQYLLSQSWHSYEQHARLLIEQGQVDPLMIEKIIGPIPSVSK